MVVVVGGGGGSAGGDGGLLGGLERGGLGLQLGGRNGGGGGLLGLGFALLLGRLLGGDVVVIVGGAGVGVGEDSGLLLLGLLAAVLVLGLIQPLASVLLHLGDAVGVLLDGGKVEDLHAVDAGEVLGAAAAGVGVDLGLLDDVLAVVAVE